MTTFAFACPRCIDRAETSGTDDEKKMVWRRLSLRMRTHQWIGSDGVYHASFECRCETCDWTWSKKVLEQAYDPASDIEVSPALAPEYLEKYCCSRCGGELVAKPNGEYVIIVCKHKCPAGVKEKKNK